jgi:hypothetical protein
VRQHGIIAGSKNWRNVKNRKEIEMKALRVRITTTSFALVLFAGAALTFSITSGAAPVWASSEQSGNLHVTKECSQYHGAPGEFCTITGSNVGPIKANSTRVYYDQAAGPPLGTGVPLGMLDSNVVLDAGGGNRAFGRCSLDLSNFTGLCTFSDGTGEFAGFQARVNITPLGADSLGRPSFGWNGTYSFGPGHGHD